jgi:hypothetical protein
MAMNEVECHCTADCPRHGKCAECVVNHRQNPNKPLPHCLRDENRGMYDLNK